MLSSGLGRKFLLGVTCLLMSSGFVRVVTETTVYPQRKPPCDSQICRLSHVHSVTCEGSQAKLQCGKGQILVIHRADYGRHDQTTCSNLQSDCMLRDVLCSSPESIEVVAESCNGKNSCTISATSSVFGNPCFGTYKYLEVDYTCQFQSATCEGSQANLQCDKGQVLVIHGADYGRHDKTTCSAGRPASQLQVVQCSSQTSTDVVAKSCNGKNSCTVSASNSVFGDPCVGTYKYLEVVYTCQFQTVTCEGFGANLQCAEGQVLVVHRAHFGRLDKTTCSAGRSACQIKNVDCTTPASINLVTDRCSGKNNCSLSAASSVFGDPCIGTYKYLEVDYTCQFQSVTCEGSQANLQCGEGQIIVVHGAHYGRHDKTTCSDGRPASQLQVVTCSSQSSTDVVAASCNGKKSCTIPATNSVFGDPCVGTYKYMQVVYTCQFQTVTCEGSQINLQCGKGQVLVIHRADYGRRDKITCSAGRPASQLQLETCSSPRSKDVVANSCNGKNSCTISASNSVFGDPCVGTYKYLGVVYACY